MADRGAGRSLPPAGRQIQGHRDGAGDAADRARHAAGARRLMVAAPQTARAAATPPAQGIVIAQQPLPRPAKTRLTPPFHPRQPAPPPAAAPASTPAATA